MHDTAGWRIRVRPNPRYFTQCVSIAGVLALCFMWKAVAETQSVEKWGVEEILLQSTLAHRNPFTDVELRCRFVSGNHEVEVYGFYDGDNTWRVRFMPEEQGEWTYTTSSNDPQLNGRSGTFLVGPPGRDNHGLVRVKNTYHFAYADGTPYFLLGTTLYNWLNRDPDLEQRTLSTLEKSPFNKVRFLVFPKWMAFNHVEPRRFPYIKQADGHFDFDRFDPEFFAHYEARLKDLETLGIEADIILFHPYDKWGFAQMDAKHDEMYLRYVVARFAAFRNVWWTLANEFDVFPRQKNWKELGELLANIDPYHHLRGIHNCCLGFYDNSQNWIDHVILQDITAQRLPASPGVAGKLELDARQIRKPVVVDEYGYEGNNGAAWGNLGPREALEIHWSLTMAGAYASHGETYVNPGHLLWWSVGGELVGDEPPRLGFLKRIMMEAPFSEMEPAPDVVRNGDDTVTALAKRGSYYLVHFAQQKQAPDWNIGVFGPATPSKPLLPVPPLDHGKFKAPPIPEFDLGEGIFRVDMIDTWNMKVYPLGYTDGSTQRFMPQMAPGVMRFVRVNTADPGKPRGPVQELLEAFGLSPR
jgi:hypothetical protein